MEESLAYIIVSAGSSVLRVEVMNQIPEVRFRRFR